MKYLYIFLILLLTAVPVYSDVGISLVSVPHGSVSKVTSHLNAKIENIGYDRAFVALPQGWKINPIDNSVKAYAVRRAIWRIYFSPIRSDNLFRTDHVYNMFDYIQMVQNTEINNREGWWLMPNEGIIINIKLTLPASGEVDPMKVQEENPNILVRKWNQEFILDVSSNGVITAPWVVKGATLTTASPPPLGDSNKISTMDFYYIKSYRKKYERNYNISAWDKWFPVKNSLTYSFKPSYNSGNFSEFSQPPEKNNYVRPVWRTSGLKQIEYTYDWVQGKEISGISLLNNDFKNIPSWSAWFYDY